MKTINILWSILLGMILFISCSDLDTYPEGKQFTEDQKKDIVGALPERLTADISGMFAAIGAQYSVYGEKRPRDDDFGYPMACISWDLNTADMVSTNDSYNWFSLASDFSDRTYTYANPYMRWAMFYNQIKQANDILASIPSGTEQETLMHYQGLAYATRAFSYFSLIQNYQFTYKGNEDKPGIPIVVNDMENPSSNPRATVQVVYDLIMNDLDTAIVLLDGFSRAQFGKGYIDQQVAYGLRARVNLVMQNWNEALADATTALAGYSPYTRDEVAKPGFTNASDHNWMWGIILGLNNMPDAYPSWPAKLSSFSGNAYTTGVGCYKMINNLLWSKISDSDVRKGWWVDEELNSPIIENLSWGGYEGQPIGPLVIPDVKVAFLPYTNVKFGTYNGVIGYDKNAGDWCLMRAEEMILIQAEATAMSGNLEGGKKILEDFVKAYRDPSYKSVAMDVTSFQNEVWFQRRVELWGEGFAFADAMRLKKNIVRFNNRIKTNFPDAFKFNISANDGWLLNRIPQAEVNSNSGISDSDNNQDGSLPVSGAGAGLLDGVTD